MAEPKDKPTRKQPSNRKDKKAAKAKMHRGNPKIKSSKEHRRCGPIGYFLRTGRTKLHQ